MTNSGKEFCSRFKEVTAALCDMLAGAVNSKIEGVRLPRLFTMREPLLYDWDRH